MPGLLPWIATHFGLGVHLFFALSAFSLAWANPHAAERPGPYLVKRFFRIAPLYWLLATVILLRSGWPGGRRILAEYGFGFNFVPGWHGGLVPAGWTVGVEMPFYLVLPLLLRIRGIGGMALAATLATALSWAARRWLEAAMPGSDYPQRHWPAMPGSSSSPCWPTGSSSGCAARRGRVRRPQPRRGSRSGCSASCSRRGRAAGGPGNADLLLFGLAFSALCLWQALRPSWLLRCRPALWLGERSYSIYLAHFLLILALRPAYARIVEALGQGGAAYLACLAITLPPLCLAAALGYRLVEQPGIALGRWLIRRREARAALAPA